MAAKVLIVDDEPAILRSTALMLEEFGYDVATCDDAQRIVATIERVRPDVVLQDIRMPGLDLDHLVATLRADPRWKRLPFVLFTASMESESIGQRVGAVLVLDKPFRPTELTSAIQSALATTA